MRQSLILTLISLFALTSSASQPIESRLATLFDTRYPDATAPGAAMIVAKGNQILFERYRGVADYGTGAIIEPATRFNIASISKQFTAAAAMLLQERRMIDLNNHIIHYYPQLRADVMREVTFRHLLSHSSGIPDARPRSDRHWVLTATDEESIDYLPDVTELHFRPGTAYEYINPTFQIFYDLIQRLSGLSFTDFMAKNVFEPAGMTDSQYFDANIDMPSASHAYIPATSTQATGSDSRGGKWQEFDYGEETFFATKADGGLYCTARDLLSWNLALRDARVISHISYEAMCEPITEVSGSTFSSYQNRPNTFYGLGLFIDTTPGRPVKIYHTGDNGGYQAYLAYYPACDISIIVLENRNDLDRWSFATAIDEALAQASLLSR